MNFKVIAGRHQATFRVEHLGLRYPDERSYILNDSDAQQGLNFYKGIPGLLSVVERRYRWEERKEMYANMLRSEHIPFNLFGPLLLEPSGHIACGVFQQFLAESSISRIQEIKIEWAPCPRGIYLDDRTSFDAYLAGVDTSGKSIGIGVEVKYTEQSYPWGNQEKSRMQDPKKASPYHRVSKASRMYNEDSLVQLATPRYKQIWRNHLLGESLVQNGCLDKFISVLLYPECNTYQKEAGRGYTELLDMKSKDRFVPITYERFIQAGRTVCKTLKPYLEWLDYLEMRYIVREDDCRAHV